MGMFDSFVDDYACENCGLVQKTEFQTKEFDCSLNVWRKYDIVRDGLNYVEKCDYGIVCKGCKKYMYPEVHIVEGIFVPFMEKPPASNDTYAIMKMMSKAVSHQQKALSNKSKEYWKVYDALYFFMEEKDKEGFMKDFHRKSLEEMGISVPDDCTAEKFLEQLYAHMNSKKARYSDYF